MTPDLDYSPLDRRPSVRDRLRAAGASTIWVYSTTLGVFMTVVPLLGLVGTITLADDPDAGFVVLMAMIAACGVFVLVSVLWQVGGDAAVGALARANELDLTQSSTAEHYAGSRFLDGTLLVHRSVRTRAQEGFLEVGDTFPVGARISQGEDRRARVFLRVGLAGPVPPRPVDEIVDPELDRRLQRWAGRYVVEWAEHELTLHGGRTLAPRDPGRVREGLELAEELRRRADEVVVAAADDDAAACTAAEQTPSGIPVPVLTRREAPVGGTRRRPWVVVVSLLAVLVVAPFLIALVFSSLEGVMRGRSYLVELVMGFVVLGLATGFSALLRVTSGPGRRAARDAASEPVGGTDPTGERPVTRRSGRRPGR